MLAVSGVFRKGCYTRGDIRVNKNILIVFLIFFSLWSELGFCLDKHDQQIRAEIERIEIYFRGNLIVSKIPPWVERASVNTDVAKL